MTNTMTYTLNTSAPMQLLREIGRRSSIAQCNGGATFRLELRRKDNGEVMAKRVVRLSGGANTVAQALEAQRDAVANMLSVLGCEEQRGEDAHALQLVVTLTSAEDAELKDVFTMYA